MEYPASWSTRTGAAPEQARRTVARGLSPAEPMTFRQLCDRILVPETRYLVLDLDRTVHRGINMGEMLGWELGAWHAYGDAGLDRMEPGRGAGRIALDYSRPTASASYTVQGLRNWALPGLIYLLGGKIPARSPWLGKQLERTVGRRWLLDAQRPTQRRLLQLLSRENPAVVERLAQRVWQRHRGRQVVTREAIESIRGRCPRIEVILASASPEAMVGFAARMLGIETFLASTESHINSGVEKIAQLRRLRPDIFERTNRTVGVTDTQYGEDHCWIDHFDILADVNSAWPFPSEVRTDSPLQEVHSVRLLTRDEVAAVDRVPSSRDQSDQSIAG